jgi:hypothetical protein
VDAERLAGMFDAHRLLAGQHTFDECFDHATKAYATAATGWVRGARPKASSLRWPVAAGADRAVK